MREYAPLTLTLLAPGARVAEPMPPGRVTLDDPAFSVMTDLREVSAAVTTPEAKRSTMGVPRPVTKSYPGPAAKPLLPLTISWRSLCGRW